MTENFQILATLVAVQIVLSLAPEREGRTILAAALLSRRDGLAATARAWAIGVVRALVALAALSAIGVLPSPSAEAVRIVCALHLAWLGLRTVRASFRGAPVPATEPLRFGPFAELVAPAAILHDFSILAVTGVPALSLGEQILAATALPTVAALWNAHLAVCVANPPIGRALRRGHTRLQRLLADALAHLGLALAIGRR
ncbi:MAG: hypothetical protein GX458_03460 [Phyllobacteriaceae bacterium]|nr:hypothetical protein [Phyllobacteriaceae bacterium]